MLFVNPILFQNIFGSTNLVITPCAGCSGGGVGTGALAVAAAVCAAVPLPARSLTRPVISFSKQGLVRLLRYKLDNN